MEINIEIEELRKRKIFVATPMYGGACAGIYTKSSVDLAMLATKYGVDVRFFYLFNESLVTRARNYLVDEFLRNKEFTHLMFIDSDIGFDPNDVLAMAAIADPESDKGIVCGPYPKKTIAWEKVKTAVDKGFGDNDPGELENYIGDYVFNPIADSNEIRLDEPVRVMEGGTGFMIIRRDVLEAYVEAYPDLSYKPDHVRTDHFDGSREITAFFDTVIDPKTKRYLSEDYMFCQYAKAIGYDIWFCPWMRLSHIGTYTFSGSLYNLAQVGQSATADVGELNKVKEWKKSQKKNKKS